MMIENNINLIGFVITINSSPECPHVTTTTLHYATIILVSFNFARRNALTSFLKLVWFK